MKFPPLEVNKLQDYKYGDILNDEYFENLINTLEVKTVKKYINEKCTSVVIMINERDIEDLNCSRIIIHFDREKGNRLRLNIDQKENMSINNLSKLINETIESIEITEHDNTITFNIPNNNYYIIQVKVTNIIWGINEPGKGEKIY